MDYGHNGQILVDCHPYVYGTHDAVANNSLKEVFVRKRLELGSPITANMFVKRVLRQPSKIYPQAAATWGRACERSGGNQGIPRITTRIPRTLLAFLLTTAAAAAAATTTTTKTATIMMCVPRPFWYPSLGTYRLARNSGHSGPNRG